MKNINWKIVGATLTSLLTMLAALPYQLGDLATIIPPDWKAKVFVVGAIATVVLRLWNTNMGAPQPPTNPTTPTKQ